MIRVELSKEDKIVSWDLALRRSGSMGHKNTKNSRNFKMESKERHYVGALGEKAYSNYTGYPVDTTTIGCGDDGTDFPDGIQVKGARTKKLPNLLIPVDQYERKICESYVLIWVKDNCGILLGIINREVVDKVKEFKKKGDMGMYCDTWFTAREHMIDLYDLDGGFDDGRKKLLEITGINYFD